MAPLVIEFKKYALVFDVKVCVTGQHMEMLDQVLEFFEIKPDFNLKLMKPNQTLFDVTADGLKGLEKVLDKVVPDVIFVQGDTTTAFIGALAGYYRKIDGMMWGPSIRQGILANNLFTPPDLAFSLQLPETWDVHNYPEFLQARNPQTGAIVQIGVTSLKKDESLDSLLKRMSNDKKLEVSKNENGVSAKIIAKPRDGDEQPARISAIALDKSLALTLMGTSAANYSKPLAKSVSF